MARFNEILAGRFNRALQKFLSMKGGPPAAQLASEIGAMFVFNRMGADFRYLESWNRYGVTFTIGGVALNQGTFRLRNPLGSNVIAVVEKLNFIGQAGIATNTQMALGHGSRRVLVVRLGRATHGWRVGVFARRGVGPPPS